MLLGAGGMWALLHWLYGTWSLSIIRDILISKLGQYWMRHYKASQSICFTLLGIIRTLDGWHAIKLNNGVDVCLRVIALGLLYSTILDERVAAGAVVLLMTNGWLLAVAR
jgi:hypothetical protein